MFTPLGLHGTVRAIVSGGLTGDASLVQVVYNYHPVDYTQIHTYPLRPIADAWRLLQSGAGYTASAGSPTAVVRRVFLGYFY